MVEEIATVAIETNSSSFSKGIPLNAEYDDDDRYPILNPE
jgi:hypothetical protein